MLRLVVWSLPPRCASKTRSVVEMSSISGSARITSSTRAVWASSSVSMVTSRTVSFSPMLTVLISPTRLCASAMAEARYAN